MYSNHWSDGEVVMRCSMKSCMLFLLLVTVVLFVIPGRSAIATVSTNQEVLASILYVKPGGSGDCSSWAAACDLITAVYRAQPGDQVWVSKGWYTPTNTSNRDVSFQLESGVALYGGFPAIGGDWNSRNWETNRTYLSGDIGTSGNISDNTYHVVTANEVDGTAILDGFFIIYGNADDGSGGGLYAYYGSPIVRNVAFAENRAEAGGGMYVFEGSPIISDVRFENNTGSEEGGGLYLESSDSTLTTVYFNGNFGGYGGGMEIYYGSPVLMNVTFSGNTAQGAGGGLYTHSSNPQLSYVELYNNYAVWGGGMYSTSGQPKLENVIFEENEAYNFGGGMYSAHGQAILENVIFEENEAETGGGYEISSSTVAMENVDFLGNYADDGAGIYTNQSTLSIENALFHGNIAESRGGGLYNYNTPGKITLSNVTFNNNGADTGGGIHSYSELVLNNITLTNNKAYNGGGLFLDHFPGSSLPATLSGVTFVNNIAENFGGGIYTTRDSVITNTTFWSNQANVNGGGMYSVDADPTLTNVTFSQNTAVLGGGLANMNGIPVITNSIFWGNYPNSIHNGSTSSIVTYSDIQYGYAGEGNISTDPILGDLAYNGGLTSTSALGIGSPAIDTGSTSNCPSTDQRGLPRPFDGDNDGSAICDMGAYEWQTATLSVDVIGSGKVNKSPDKLTYTAGETVTLTAIPNYGWLFSGWSGDISSKINPVEVIVMGEMHFTASFVEVVGRIFMPLVMK